MYLIFILFVLSLLLFLVSAKKNPQTNSSLLQVNNFIYLLIASAIKEIIGPALVPCRRSRRRRRRARYEQNGMHGIWGAFLALRACNTNKQQKTWMNLAQIRYERYRRTAHFVLALLQAVSTVHHLNAFVSNAHTIRESVYANLRQAMPANASLHIWILMIHMIHTHTNRARQITEHSGATGYRHRVRTTHKTNRPDVEPQSQPCADSARKITHRACIRKVEYAIELLCCARNAALFLPVCLCPYINTVAHIHTFPFTFKIMSACV